MKTFYCVVADSKECLVDDHFEGANAEAALKQALIEFGRLTTEPAVYIEVEEV